MSKDQPEEGTHHRTPQDAETNITELNTWRRVKVDPMLDKHQKLLVDGDGPDSPSIVLSQGLLHGKFDTLIWIGKIVVALITIFGTLMTIMEVGGPWLRQKLGLPSSYMQTPAPPVKPSPPPQLQQQGAPDLTHTDINNRGNYENLK